MFTSLLGNDPKLTVLIEPYLSYLQIGSFRWTDATGRERVSISPPTTQMQRMLNQSASDAMIVFKETWRGADSEIFPTESFIRANQCDGMTTIAIVRDPRAVWWSMIGFCGHAVETTPSRNFLDDFREFADWVRDGDVSFIRYEDAVVDPAVKLADLARRIGRDIRVASNVLANRSGVGDDSARAGGPIHQDSTQRWTTLPAETRQVLQCELSDVFDQFGYEIDAPTQTVQ